MAFMLTFISFVSKIKGYNGCQTTIVYAALFLISFTRKKTYLIRSSICGAIAANCSRVATLACVRRSSLSHTLTLPSVQPTVVCRVSNVTCGVVVCPQSFVHRWCGLGKWVQSGNAVADVISYDNRRVFLQWRRRKGKHIFSWRIYTC